MKHVLKEMQCRLTVIFETLSMYKTTKNIITDSDNEISDVSIHILREKRYPKLGVYKGVQGYGLWVF